MNGIDLHVQAASIFREAALYIRIYGWQVTGMSEHGLPRCSMGALASAHKEARWNKGLATLMYKTLYEELNGLTLTEFNHKYNDGEKVAQLFDEAAASLAATKILAIAA
jgi:hypothetical protein